MRNHAAPLGLALLGALLAGCAPLSEPRAPGDSDPRLGQSAFIEEGDLVAFVVGTRVTRSRDERDYVPVEVAIANKGLKSLTLTRESFTLVDEEGLRYGAVGKEELLRGYGDVDVDRRLGELGPLVRGRFQSYEQLPSTLTPSFDRPIEQRLLLPRFTLAIDFLYFPRPRAGIVERRFELFLTAPELPDPVFVRFRVQGRP